MALGTIEIIALILVIAVIIKLLVIIISRKSWIGVVKAIYGKPVILVIVELVLAVVLFYYLLQSLTLVQIMACVLLGAVLTGLSFAFYSKELMQPMLRMLKTPILKKAWFLVLLWLGLCIWTLLEIF